MIHCGCGALASRPFDGEGLEGVPLNMVENGVLKHWLLSTSTAKELGLTTNGRGVTLRLDCRAVIDQFCYRAWRKDAGRINPQPLAQGFYVTELFGQGVDMVTGQYSRGATRVLDRKR